MPNTLASQILILNNARMKLMDKILLEPITTSEFARYSDWFNESASDVLSSASGSLESVLAGASRPLAWRLTLDSETLALVTISVDTVNIGRLNLVVDPRARRRGVGSATIKQLLRQPEMKQLRALESEVDSSNVGGQKILIKNGFAKVGHTPSGNILFRLR